MNDLLTRSITGLIFVAVVVGAILYSPVATLILFSLVCIMALIEFNRLFSGHKSFEISWEWYTLLSTVIFGLGLGVILNFFPFEILYFIFPLSFLLFAMELFRKKEHPIANMSLFGFQIFYLIVPFLLLIQLRYNTSPSLVIGMFVLTWANDTFAYLWGRLFGKTKLFERISPKKTWEGTIGGALTTIVFSILYAFLFGKSEGIFFWVFAAIIIIPTAVIGDLLESLMKRSLNIKDSGNILPGHGGILDRFDAALFSIPFFYVYCVIYTYFWVLI